MEPSCSRPVIDFVRKNLWKVCRHVFTRQASLGALEAKPEAAVKW